MVQPTEQKPKINWSQNFNTVITTLSTATFLYAAAYFKETIVYVKESAKKANENSVHLQKNDIKIDTLFVRVKIGEDKDVSQDKEISDVRKELKEIQATIQEDYRQKKNSDQK